jgi:hypothetical protein
VEREVLRKKKDEIFTKASLHLMVKMLKTPLCKMGVKIEVLP